MSDLKGLDALAELNGVDADVIRAVAIFDGQSRVTELNLWDWQVSDLPPLARLRASIVRRLRRPHTSPHRFSTRLPTPSAQAVWSALLPWEAQEDEHSRWITNQALR